MRSRGVHDISFGALPLHEGFRISSCEIGWLRGGGETNLSTTLFVDDAKIEYFSFEISDKGFFLPLLLPSI